MNPKTNLIKLKRIGAFGLKIKLATVLSTKHFKGLLWSFENDWSGGISVPFFILIKLINKLSNQLLIAVNIWTIEFPWIIAII